MKKPTDKNILPQPTDRPLARNKERKRSLFFFFPSFFSIQYDIHKANFESNLSKVFVAKNALRCLVSKIDIEKNNFGIFPFRAIAPKTNL